ncbi:MAG: tetratricopeptide repeat protein, partial [Cyanobacteria bacterium J06649_11]
PEAHYNIGSILYNQGKHQQALEAFRKAAEANPDYPSAYYGAGLAFLQMREYPDAMRVLAYARDLFLAQNNSQWARNAEQLMQQAQNFTGSIPPR